MNIVVSNMTIVASMTVSDVIDALGGNTPVAALFGVGTSAVSNWRAQGEFPQRIHYRLARECERRGVALDPALLEVSSREKGRA